MNGNSPIVSSSGTVTADPRDDGGPRVQPGESEAVDDHEVREGQDDDEDGEPSDHPVPVDDVADGDRRPNEPDVEQLTRAAEPHPEHDPGQQHGERLERDRDGRERERYAYLWRESGQRPKFHRERGHGCHVRFAPLPEGTQPCVPVRGQCIVALDDSCLDGLQLGRKRNYGYGTTKLKDTQVVDPAELDYSRLNTAEDFVLELVTPFVLESEYPAAANPGVPWWWEEDREALRERLEKVWGETRSTTYNS